mmetsp:Transcript_58718/g.163867  ORF Transcript_58718/g.163867 Transcript_58718/m.163867 type:complete len:205 (+) Transcript_58718:210-824(+)
MGDLPHEILTLDVPRRADLGGLHLELAHATLQVLELFGLRLQLPLVLRAELPEPETVTHAARGVTTAAISWTRGVAGGWRLGHRPSVVARLAVHGTGDNLLLWKRLRRCRGQARQAPRHELGRVRFPIPLVDAHEALIVDLSILVLVVVRGPWRAPWGWCPRVAGRLEAREWRRGRGTSLVPVVWLVTKLVEELPRDQVPRPGP